MGIWDKIDGFFRGKPEPEPELAKAELAIEPPAPPKVKKERSKQRTTYADDRRIEAEARALFVRGDAKGAIALLDEQAILFARHEASRADALPCLCRNCLVPDAAAHEAQGIPFVRDFVVSRHHVLFYWTPRELEEDATRVRHSMRAAVRYRLKGGEKPLSPPNVPRRNPFTGQMEMPHPPRRRTNPFRREGGGA